MKTLNDSRKEKEIAWLRREAAIERRELRALRAKIKRWEKNVALYGGEVHGRTLAKFRCQLALLTLSK